MYMDTEAGPRGKVETGLNADRTTSDDKADTGHTKYPRQPIA